MKSIAVILTVIVLAKASVFPLARPASSFFEDRPDIVGGEETKIEETPSTGAMLTSTLFQFCACSILSEKYALSAAHCCVGHRPEEIRLSFGSSERHNGLIINVASLIVHPGYSSRIYDNDYCILVLKDPIQKWTDTIQPARLPNLNERVPNNNELVAFGWGSTKNSTIIVKNIRRVVVKKVDQKACEKSYEKVNPITDNMVCAADNGKDACQGDSGGPLVDRLTKKLFGVTSWGMGCAEPNYPGVYSFVSTARRWIFDICGV